MRAIAHYNESDVIALQLAKIREYAIQYGLT